MKKPTKVKMVPLAGLTRFQCLTGLSSLPFCGQDRGALCGQDEVSGTSLAIGKRLGRLPAAALSTRARSPAALPQQSSIAFHQMIDLEEIIVLDCGGIRDELRFIP
jgi:hypothetical protein